MTPLKTMSEDDLLEKIKFCKSIGDIKDIKALADAETAGLDHSATETIYKLIYFVQNAIENPAPGDHRTKKSLKEILESNPGHLKENILHNKLNLSENAAYFFSQANVPTLLEFLCSHDIQIEMRGKDLDNTVKALSRFLMTYTDYQRDAELFQSQESWVKEYLDTI